MMMMKAADDDGEDPKKIQKNKIKSKKKYCDAGQVEVCLGWWLFALRPSQGFFVVPEYVRRRKVCDGVIDLVDRNL